MLAKITLFVKKRKNDIMLTIVIILISLLSFSIGYITSMTQNKKDLEIRSESMEQK